MRDSCDTRVNIAGVDVDLGECPDERDGVLYLFMTSLEKIDVFRGGHYQPRVMYGPGRRFYRLHGKHDDLVLWPTPEEATRFHFQHFERLEQGFYALTEVEYAGVHEFGGRR